MSDTLVEILLEIIVNGALDASDSKKVAMPVRILLAAGVVLFLGAVVGILIWNGIARGSLLLTICGVLFLALVILLAVNKITRFQRARRR